MIRQNITVFQVSKKLETNIFYIGIASGCTDLIILKQISPWTVQP